MPASSRCPYPPRQSGAVSPPEPIPPPPPSPTAPAGIRISGATWRASHAARRTNARRMCGPAWASDALILASSFELPAETRRKLREPIREFSLVVGQALSPANLHINRISTQPTLQFSLGFLSVSASSMRRPARVKEKTPVLAGFSCRLVADQREAHAALVFVVFPS